MKKKGFTLIELLVVIAIIALLLSIVAPSLRKAKDAARLSICASNQRQCIMGIQAYAIDNNSKLPPHPAERPDGSYSWVNYLNYAPRDKSRSKNEGTYYYLGSYLPEVSVFTCPLGPAKTSDLQDQYVNYLNVPEGTHVSYDLYWGGYTMSDIKFVGPRGIDSKSAARVLVSDSMNFWFLDQWWLSHRPQKGNIIQQTKDPLYGNDCSIFWILQQPPNVIPTDLKMNAGYVDGSVNRYNAFETVMGNGRFYIPTKWR